MCVIIIHISNKKRRRNVNPSKTICKECTPAARYLYNIHNDFIQSIYVGFMKALGKKVSKYEDIGLPTEFKEDVINSLLKNSNHETLDEKLKKVIKKRKKSWSAIAERELSKLCNSCKKLFSNKQKNREQKEKEEYENK